MAAMATLLAMIERQCNFQQGVPGDAVPWPGLAGCPCPLSLFSPPSAGGAKGGVPGDAVPWPGFGGAFNRRFFGERGCDKVKHSDKIKSIERPSSHQETKPCPIQKHYRSGEKQCQ